MAEKKLKAIIETTYNGKGADQAEKDMADLAKQGQKTGKTLGGMNNVTGKMNNGLLSTAKSLAAPVLGFMALDRVIPGTAQLVQSSINDWVNYNEEVSKLSTTTTAGTEDLSRMMQAADDLGIKTEALGTAFEFASKNGVVPTIANIAALSDRMKSMTDIEARNQEMTKIFGRGWADASRFLLAGGDAIRETTAAVNENLVVTAKSAQEARDYALAVDTLADSFTAAKNKIANEALPPITEALIDIAGTNKKSTTEILSDNARQMNSWDDVISVFKEYARVNKLKIETDALGIYYIDAFGAKLPIATRMQYKHALIMEQSARIQKEYLDVAIITNGAIQDQSEAMGVDAEATGKTASSFSLLNIQMQASSQYAEESAKKALDLSAGWGKVSNKLISAADAAKKFSDSLNQVPTDISSQIEKDLTALNLREAGAGFVESLREGVMANMERGFITQQEGEDALEGLFIAFETVKVKAGELSEAEAWANVQQNLKNWGMDADNARQIFDTLLGFDGKQISFNALVNLIGRVQGFGGSIGASGGGSGSGAGLGGGGTKQTYAKGTNFVIPAGYPNDTYPIGWGQSGEEVTVTPAGQKSTGDTYISVGDVVVYESDNPQATAEAVIAIINRRMAGSRLAGARYTGA